jgi:hypothetical protein
MAVEVGVEARQFERHDEVFGEVAGVGPGIGYEGSQPVGWGGVLPRCGIVVRGGVTHLDLELAYVQVLLEIAIPAASKYGVGQCVARADEPVALRWSATRL